jgi:hypothetical protein
MKDLCANLVYASQDLIAHPEVPRVKFLVSATSLIMMFTNRPNYISKDRLKWADWPY